MRCPVCGSADVRNDGTVPFLTCGGCAEMLTPAELVKRATRRTRRAYARANGHDRHYGTHREAS